MKGISHEKLIEQKYGVNHNIKNDNDKKSAIHVI